MRETTDQSHICKRCGVGLPVTWNKEYCKKCYELVLFDEVREYIRANDVTEREVAEYFDIPREKVKRWIEDGRVEYVSTRHKLI